LAGRLTADAWYDAWYVCYCASVGLVPERMWLKNTLTLRHLLNGLGVLDGRE
jgi:hypothetical protein